ncbi:hypothetical protein ACTXGL_09880 [Psychrobacter sp. T6-6]|uniref:hypothetical protein n=1 Tax=Psychrobacter sp. T6-6 TaxID=3457452 RepID=UPI003FD4EA43
MKPLSQMSFEDKDFLWMQAYIEALQQKRENEQKHRDQMTLINQKESQAKKIADAFVYATFLSGFVACILLIIIFRFVQ